MKNWWEQYRFIGDVTYLANFTEHEFTSRIPYDIQVGVDKITVAESAEWGKYFDKYGVWPSVKQWKLGKLRLGGWKTLRKCYCLVIKKNITKELK